MNFESHDFSVIAEIIWVRAKTQRTVQHSLHTFAIRQESRNSKKSTEVTKIKLDLQSIGSSPGLHILCARDTIMIPFRTWDSFLRLGGIQLLLEVVGV